MALLGKTKPPRRKRRKKQAARLFKFAAAVIFVFLMPLALGIGTGGFFAFLKTVPSIEELKQERTFISTKIYADDDTLVGELKLKKGIHVKLQEMPQDLLDAVIAVEDANFWEHKGIDYTAIMRAAIKDVLQRHLKEGGSTITQQLAKITFLTPEKTIKRKLKEAVLATRIERDLSKKEILEFYLNRAYFGHGAYGMEMAAKVYFGKSVREVSLPESALLAGLLKAPNTYSPFRNLERSKLRQRIVLGRMENEGFITRKQKTEAIASPVYLWTEKSEKHTNNYFIEYVKREMEDRYGSDILYKGGMKIYTTLDSKVQQAAQKALMKGLRDHDKRRGYRGPAGHRDIDPNVEVKTESAFKSIPPKPGAIVRALAIKVLKKEALLKASGVLGTLKLKDASWAQTVPDPETGETRKTKKFDLTKILKPGDIVSVRIMGYSDGKASLALEQEPLVQGAIAAVEPGTGFIRAIVGGYDYRKSEFNRAIRAERQPGSAFKPVVFALAMENGFTTASIIIDGRVEFQKDLDSPKPNRDPDYNPEEDPDYDPEDFWIPENYDGKYHGPTRLRDALVYSRNIVTVKLVDTIGVGKMIKFCKQLGIKAKPPRDLTLALGSLSVTPLDLTVTYSIFANGGKLMKPIGIKYIIDRKGRVMENNAPEGRQVMDERDAFLVTSMLQDVVRYGTGWRAKALRRPVAGKTGTTNDYRDAWFLGFTRDMVAGVWVGYDDMTPLGKDETGSRAAAPIWVDFMKAVSRGLKPRDFPTPEGITTRMIDPKTGLLADEWVENPLREYFKVGTEPTEVAPSIWRAGESERMMFGPR